MNMNSGVTSTATTTNAPPAQPSTKEKYRSLKKKFKFLVYENECYQEELRNLQRRLLKLSRDKNFLLDRLMQYEKVSDSSDDSDPPTPAPKGNTDTSKQKKPKKPASTKKSRAKQPQTQPNPNPTEAVVPPSTPVSMGAAVNAATIRGRARKGTANGAGSSSDVEVVVSSGNSLIAGPTTEPEQMTPQNNVSHYPVMGAYEQLVLPPAPSNDQTL